MYFVHSAGQQLGPFSPATIEEMLKDGTFSTDCQVWTEGMDSWQPASVALSPQASPISREQVYFDRDGVRVTNSRFLPGDQTFALSAINSVKLLKVRADQRPVAVLASAAGVCILGAIGGQSVGWFFAALAFGFVAFLIYRGLRDSYAVVVSVSSGEVKALVRQDEKFIVDVVNAINQAIIGRG